MTISRYLIKEITLTTFAVIVVLSLIGTSHELVVKIGKVVSGDLPLGLVGKLLLASMPSMLIILLPIALFIGIVLAYGRLFADSEMTALFSLGLGYNYLVRLALIPAIVFFTLLLTLHNVVNPKILSWQDKQIINAQKQLLDYLITPGHFQRLGNGRVFFVENLSADNKIANNIFMAEFIGNSPSTWKITVGDRMVRWHDAETNSEYLVTEDGHSYQEQPEDKGFLRLDFAKLGIKINLPTTENLKVDLNRITTNKLLQLTSLDAKIEYLWRLTMPFSIFIVVFLAVPLSITSPRQGKYATIFPALILIMFYSVLLILNRSWLESGLLPIWLGFWAAHIVGLILGIILLIWRSGFWWRFRDWHVRPFR